MGDIDQVVPALPETLIIGGITYTVAEADAPSMYSGDLHGDIVYSKAKIRIGEFLAPEKKVQVLFHEIVHGFLVEADIESTFGEEGKEKEEKIQHLSKVFLRFVQENDLSRFYKGNNKDASDTSQTKEEPRISIVNPR